LVSAEVSQMSTVAEGTPPPLEQITPYLKSSLTAAISFTSVLLRLFGYGFSVVSKATKFFSPLPIILYLSAPLTVFLDAVMEIFIRWPYAIVLYLLDILYPVYVFVGVACIVGSLVGITGRIMSQILVGLLAIRDQEPSPLASPVVDVKPKLKSRRRRRPRSESE